MVLRPTRRGFLTGALVGTAPLVLSGCDVFGLAQSQSVSDALGSADGLARRVQHLIGGDALAPEFEAAEMSPVFRTNGNTMPSSTTYQALARGGFTGWSLAIDGLVERPVRFNLAEIMAMPSRTQITRHDCVEGWSAIGQWAAGPPRSPAAPLGWWPWLLGGIGAVLAAGIGAELAMSPSVEWGARLIGTNAPYCLTFIPLIAIGPLTCFIAALRQGMPSRPGLAGAMADVASGAMAAALYATHCPDDSPLFVATWYTVSTCIVAACGYVAGRRLL